MPLTYPAVNANLEDSPHADDVYRHILSKARHDLRHQELLGDYNRDDKKAKSAYHLVRLFNQDAIISDGWSRVLDWTPDTSMVAQTQILEIQKPPESAHC